MVEDTHTPEMPEERLNLVRELAACLVLRLIDEDNYLIEWVSPHARVRGREIHKELKARGWD